MQESERVRVLVVDDHRDEAEALAALLQLSGYSVRVVTGAKDALEVAASYQPLCVMLDIDMPEMDGLELSHRLRQAHGGDLIIIAVSGWDSDEVMRSDSVDHFLLKPVETKQLARVLPSLID